MIEQYETWEGFKETLIERVGTCFSPPFWHLIKDILDFACIQKTYTEVDAQFVADKIKPNAQFSIDRIKNMVKALESKKGKRE